VKWWIGRFCDNPIAANLLVLVVLVCGLLVYPGLDQSIHADVAWKTISVSVPYPGAPADEVQDAVTIRIEEAIRGIKGVKRISSVSREGHALLIVALQRRAEDREVLETIRSRIDAITSFPESVDRPEVREWEPRETVVYVGISGPSDERVLKSLAERVRADLAALPGVSLVELVGARPDEVSIEVSRSELIRHAISFDMVADAVRRSSVDVPGGTLKTAASELLLRVDGSASVGEQFEEIPLLSRSDGTRLTVGDVAEVVDGFAESDQRVRMNGKPAALVQILRTDEQRIIEISDAVERYVEQARSALPPGVELVRWRDSAVDLKSRRDLLMRNGLQGLVLVVGVLAVFLGLRQAMWVSLGIPMAFLGTIALMPLLGVSINMISLLAFICALGLIVDDSIVIAEGIDRSRRSGASRREAAVAGARESAVPVLAAVATTVVFLVPALFLEGRIGHRGRPFPLIMIACLGLSLVEAFLVLPSHLAGQASAAARLGAGRVARRWRRLREAVDAGLERFVEHRFGPFVERSLRWRYVALSLSVLVYCLVIGAVNRGWVPFVFLPTVESNYLTASLTMPLGTPVDTTRRAVSRLEAGAARLQEEFGADVVRRWLGFTGGQPERDRIAASSPLESADFGGAHLAEVQVELARAEVRDVAATDLLARWREISGPVPHAVDLRFDTQLFNLGEPFSVKVSGVDLAAVERASESLKSGLSGFPGVVSVSDSLRRGKPEIRLEIRPEAEAMGLTRSELGRQVRQGFHGEEVQRFARGREDVPVVVRYPRAQRRSLQDLERIHIRTPDGREVPFSTVAVAHLERGHEEYERRDGEQTVTVTAELDARSTDADAIARRLVSEEIPRLLAAHPGVDYALDGQLREKVEFLGSFFRGMIVAVLTCYALMAITLRSYLDPLAVLFAIPFGAVGAALGHALLGMELTGFTYLGLLGVAGVVINDAMVLLHAVRSNREAGMAPFDAVATACRTRFRPVLLTTVTTSLGLVPLLLEGSIQAQWIKPIAIALVFGEVFSTPVVLVAVPCLYLAFEDLRALVHERLGGSARGAPKGASAPPSALGGRLARSGPA